MSDAVPRSPCQLDRARSSWLMLLLALAACAEPTPGAVAASSDAVILLYHHVADDTPASTSVSPATFDRHLRYLADNDYQVVPLSRIVGALKDGGELPAGSVAITFDDAYRSVYHQAAPALRRFGFPFTVFVSTDYVDAGLGNYMTWEQLRELQAAGAEIGNHSQAHDHYLHRRADESPADWQRRIRQDIEGAQRRLEAERTSPLPVIAYPYGEFDPALARLADELGYVGLGQQSGPVGAGSDLQALPRFPMAGPYAELDGFAEKLRTRPFRVTVEAPDGPILESGGPPTLQLLLEAPQARLDALSCFVGGQPAPRIEWLDREAGRVAVTAARPLPVGRSKYTCTAPARDDGASFYWYSYLWMRPPQPGAWYPD